MRGSARAIPLGGDLTYVPGLIHAAPGDGIDYAGNRRRERDRKREKRAREKVELARARALAEHRRIVARILAIPPRPVRDDAG